MQASKGLKQKDNRRLFSSAHRLRQSWEFRRFFNRSEVFRLQECIVYRIENSLNHFRLGITIKTRGNSVERNRVKRIIRETFRNNAACLVSKCKGYDYNVVIPKSRNLSYSYSKRLAVCLKNEIHHVFPSR